MAEVTSMTAEAMATIRDASIVGGTVNDSGRLVLSDFAGGTHDAGSVVGPTGSTGSTGAQGPTGIGPTGTVIMYAAGTAPSGWLVCNGQAVSRSTYSALWTLVGTKFGAGDGTTTFNLPNMGGKFPRMDSSYSTNLGVTGGADTHSHQIDGGTTDAVAQITLTSTSSPNLFMNRIPTATWAVNVELGAGTGSGASSETSGAKVIGQTQVASNDPPYLNLVFLIKT